jgi:hypothetical protein
VDPSIGPLVAADEGFNHQITDTFASVAHSDRSWTEKVCAMACSRDGVLQLGFGIGKYPNRNVMDAYAGVSRGVEQWTVRASRELMPTPATTSVGPIHYEVVEPLRAIRFRLDANDVQPISFEWRFEGAVPPFLENREIHRSRDGARLDADIVRYHHTGVASGWVEVEGQRTEFGADTWVSTRDHSWGVRYQVGAPAADVAPAPVPEGVAMLIIWCPVLLERPDGTRYALHLYYQRHTFDAVGYQRIEFQGGIEHADGRKDQFSALVPELEFRDDNRRLLGGRLHFTMADGSARPIDVEVLASTGFHLGTGVYHGFDGQWHGQWRGALHLDGEHFEDCSDPQVAHRIHQHRDAVIKVTDPLGGGVGWGNMQNVVLGAHPELGLTAAASFL